MLSDVKPQVTATVVACGASRRAPGVHICADEEAAAWADNWPAGTRGLRLIHVVVKAPRGFGAIARTGTARPTRRVHRRGVETDLARQDTTRYVDPDDENRWLLRIDRLFWARTVVTEHVEYVDEEGCPVRATIERWIVRPCRVVFAVLVALRERALARRDAAQDIPARRPQRESRPPPAQLVDSLTIATLAP